MNNLGTINFDKVNKYFYLQHQKTLKEFAHAIFKKKKTIEQVHALEKVSFSIKKGESIGIIGKNGAGKSTLLKLIAKVSSPTSGEVKVCGRVAPLIELGAGFHAELTGIENIYLNGVIMGLKEKYISEKINEIIAFSEIKEYINTAVKYYSSGMYMRLAFSVAIFVDPDILLIDEIFAVGDENFQRKCLKKMEKFKKNKTTVIFVSHDLKTVEKFCERVIYLEKGNIKYDGNVRAGIEKYLNDSK